MMNFKGRYIVSENHLKINKRNDKFRVRSAVIVFEGGFCI